jgi:hypothetical protein
MVLVDPLHNVLIERNVNGGSVRHPDFAIACGFEDPGNHRKKQHAMLYTSELTG